MQRSPRELPAIWMDLLGQKCSVENRNFTCLEKEEEPENSVACSCRQNQSDEIKLTLQRRKFPISSDGT